MSESLAKVLVAIGNGAGQYHYSLGQYQSMI